MSLIKKLFKFKNLKSLGTRSNWCSARLIFSLLLRTFGPYCHFGRAVLISFFLLALEKKTPAIRPVVEWIKLQIVHSFGAGIAKVVNRSCEKHWEIRQSDTKKIAKFFNRSWEKNRKIRSSITWKKIANFTSKTLEENPEIHQLFAGKTSAKFVHRQFEKIPGDSSIFSGKISKNYIYKKEL